MKQEDFIRYAEDGENIFLTGNAGTGKSFIVNEFIKNSSKKIVAVAPTGVAAINIGGSTIHSAFSVPIGVEKFTYIKKQKIDWSFIDILIIDEISMVGSWVVEYIDLILRKSTSKDEPFGGLQVIFIGDKKQLPPVLKCPILKKEYTEEFGGLDFFYSTAYSNGDFLEIDLKENKRTTDNELINGLNKIRDNNFNINDFQILENTEVFNEINLESNEIFKESKESFENKAVHLMHKNVDVDNFNNTKIFNINGKLITFKAIIDNFEVRNFLTPVLLDLKIGAKVMITKNLQNGLCNGDIGEVLSFSGEKINVKSERDGKIYKIERETWERFDYEEDGKPISVGSFVQFPLKLAYAITVHKSQGLSFDNVIFHYSGGYVANNLIYVALSRAKTFKNLFISREFPKISRINRGANFVNMTEYEINLFKKWRLKYPKWLELNQYNFFFHKNGIEIKYLEYKIISLNSEDNFFSDGKIILREDLEINNNPLIKFKKGIDKIAYKGLNIISNGFWNALVKFMPGESEDEKGGNLLDLLNLKKSGFIESGQEIQVGVYAFYWSPELSSGLNLKKVVFGKDFYLNSLVKSSDLDYFKYSFRCFSEK